MALQTDVTAADVAAYLECPTKAWLLLSGEEAPNPFFADIRALISAVYKARAVRGTDDAPIEFEEFVRSPADGTALVRVDCMTATYRPGLSGPTRISLRTDKAMATRASVPVLFLAWDKVSQPDASLVCFAALAIAQAMGGAVPEKGEVVYGDPPRRKSVRISDHADDAKRAVGAIQSMFHTEEPPRLVLNKHCSTCGYQTRCRAIAVERDDLSLLGAMTAKERAKFEEKGVSTIGQLSYGYRPRRRTRRDAAVPRRAPPAKHDHKLKALAIKKGQIHVVGSPSLFIEGTVVFLDVEGMPDQDLYYLVGLRFERHGVVEERGFWADAPDSERDLWEGFLQCLSEIADPTVVHYGAYETRFLKRMRERWGTACVDAAFLDRIIDRSVNLLATMYGRIYFPTFSNSLKEVARWLGFDWTSASASGGAAALARRAWELTGDDRYRQLLVEYNMEDCRAAEVVANALAGICNGHAAGFETVDVGSLEVSFQRTFGKFVAAMPEFEKINAAAYWDYQRSKVYVRTGKLSGRSASATVRPAQKDRVDKEVAVEDRPETCVVCGSPEVWCYTRRGSHVITDLRFTRKGIRKETIRYIYRHYRCGACRAERTLYRKQSKHGPNVRAFVAYLIIEMRLSNQKVSEHLSTVFNVNVQKSQVNDIKCAMAKHYAPMHQRILERVAAGPLVHADETKAVVRGGGHYIWVFANMSSVAYVHSASREASILDSVLAGFRGVLVSDFYGGYDGVPCRQQKCLIHLMRDVNEDLLKHPFNEELVFVAKRFGALLREIVETIDRWGLKKRHLGKHRRAAETFLNDVADLTCATDAANALKKRIEKNRDKLFTFLEHDDIPWNNNNAEHAVRAFTRLRNAMGTSTAKGTADYCTLLSVQQTLRCRGIGFLDFLRSGRTDIDS